MHAGDHCHGGDRVAQRGPRGAGDTGIGIAPDDIAKVLTPFGQVVAQDGEQREGTGLGLPIARCLVERHGGSLNIESRLDRGTRVRISLPALRANTARLTL